MDLLTLSRRQFLKAVGITGLTALTNGCTDATRKLIPFVAAPEDIIPGESTWYATTCRECPAGCGMLAKNRDGRVIKVEGNPLHPVNTGSLCPRGQASVQGVYNPDRYRQPLKKPAGSNKFSPITWKEAEDVVLSTLTPIVRQREGQKVVFLTDLTTGSEDELIRRFLGAMGSDQLLMYESLGYEALREANSDIFGISSIPCYRIDTADFLISFGANFLETWISNVQFARQFARFREPGRDGRNPFIYVGPRLSVTGTNADHWISVPPDGESLVALGLLHVLLKKNHTPALDKDDEGRVKAAVKDFTPQLIEERTGVKTGVLNNLASSFIKARRPLALAEGTGCGDLRALDTARATNLLCSLTPGTRETIDFSNIAALSNVAKAKDIKVLADRMHAGEVDILFILRANPVFHLPPGWRFSEALRRVSLVVSLSSFPDETSEMAHLILPVHTFLESWGDHAPWTGIRGLMQPVTVPMFDTRAAGDILLSLGKSLKGAEIFPEKDFYEVLRRSWDISGKKVASQANPEAAWEEALQRGGSWRSHKKQPFKPAKVSVPVDQPFLPLSPATPREPIQQNLSFISYPTIQFFDGRTANRPFLQELPDPVTNITWDGWVEIHPETANRLNIQEGDLLQIGSEFGSIQAPAYPYPGIWPDTLAMPMGHGHSSFGRYAKSETGNVVHVCGGGPDRAGGMIRAVPFVKVTKTGKSVRLAHTDGSGYQHGRNLVRSISWREYASTTTDPPDVVLPLPEGFRKDRDFYRSHTHDIYRWCMVVDLDRCMGCGACVVACYAENNIGVVGRDRVLMGRQMSWLRIERYFEQQDPLIRFLPMLCQHCDEAPCESVCPVFAPNHSREGINNQVYNRCIGTRFCNQNCPYKVRRFNWFTWTHDPPLEWQLNPDVTVRTKGVMEKCSFCIQRIVEAKMKAKSENRIVRDGEFAPACVQTCPTDALIFGNLKDPESRVANLVRLSRAYQVLGDLNTKPGVIYLKRIIRNVF